MSINNTTNKEGYLISEASEISKLPSKTIRYYEDIGLIPSPQRSKSGYRVFTKEDIRRLKLIKKAKYLGISLEEIKEIVDLAFEESCRDFEERFVTLLSEKISEVNETINELYDLRRELVNTKNQITKNQELFRKDCRAGECEECSFIDE
ncbi:MerR family transcriptional regulator [Natranaerofaba carboxydovora]|uniref:MerR family transcriptional regulator n=1 Tax=Natranaerofaba carboxydovora TaxID=2742683 RepID=UPI001F130C49|nr:MerR family transcriptional regulator [Natranaerofaba carboxydovora]UMZ72914.1 HTH-type transcriptional regulator HmrR [Natranaerofaba carboxydovora]